MEDSPRPHKRARISPPSDDHEKTSQLHGPQLLLALPSLLLHPPTHENHKRSLWLSLLALRRCLGLPNPGQPLGKKKKVPWDITSTPLDECRAWCALAEVGILILEGGFGDEDWTEGIEGEIQKALGKALVIAQKHPTLSLYPHYINRLSARATPTRAKQLLKPMPVGGPEENTPAYYYAHLAWTDHLLHALLYPTAAPKPSAKFSTPMSTPVKAPADKSFGRELSGLRAAMGPLFGAEHPNVVLLARIIELRALVALGRWSDVPAALERAENDLGITFLAPTHPPPLYTTSTFHAVVTIHVLVLGVVWYTYSAAAAPESESSPSNINESPVGRRLTLLYTVLDAGIYNGKRREAEEEVLEAEGVLAVPLDHKHPPLFVRTTHPRVLYALGYLISAIARRDLVGRKPKRKTFILEGLGVVDREAVRELKVPRWASAGDVQTIELQMAKIQADLKCELVSTNIMRSEFAEAEKTLNEVIAHTRTFGLFEGTLAPRITLLHAQLAHARGQAKRAQTCYRVAAKLATAAGDIAGSVAARVGEVVLLLGLRARARVDPLARIPMADDKVDVDEKDLERMAHEVAASCRGLGGAMRAVGEVIEGVLTSEILTAKQHLKHALAFATDHQDNHLRALILALISAHYLHTASDQAGKMLGTCEQLAAGLGAPPRKEKDKQKFDSSGNVPLRLWAGERYLELHKRVGQTEMVQKRTEANTMLRQAATTSPQHTATMAHQPLAPPRPPFADSASASSRSSSPGPNADAGSVVSLQINYLPTKFSNPLIRRRRGTDASGQALLKRGGGVDAFRAGEPRMPGSNDDNYDGLEFGPKATRRAKWNRFKWVLVFSNSVYTIISLAALVFIITAWLDVWAHADVVRVGNRTELVLTTLAASVALLTSLIGWAGIVMNNRGFLAVYTFFLWIAFALLVTPGYLTYKRYAFNLEGKVNKQWSEDLGDGGRLRIQNQLHCCGYFSPFVEATVSQTCYARSILPGCKESYWFFERSLLHRWFVAVFSLVPVNIGAIVAGLLCSNHVTYRFGKGRMPKAYRMSEKSMAIVVGAYAQQLADQYGADMAEEMMGRSYSVSPAASDNGK
uniref:ER transporter 6TM N-terminal domain-containing protein n=1 Tax=Mycena chlorophos TaxID=658473 RepID=A0ABQ0LJ38_MYCCL|nr:predicted protein [Mycena chlorophos]